MYAEEKKLLDTNNACSVALKRRNLKLVQYDFTRVRPVIQIVIQIAIKMSLYTFISALKGFLQRFYLPRCLNREEIQGYMHFVPGYIFSTLMKEQKTLLNVCICLLTAQRR